MQRVNRDTESEGATMLLIIGKTLGVGEQVGGRPGEQFSYTEIVLQTGEGVHTAVQRVRVARDFPASKLPAEGEECALHVVIRAYAGKGGPGFNLTALANVTERFAALV